MSRLRLGALVLAAFAGGLPARAQDLDDPSLRAAVERFFAAQVAEDVDAYLALWSSNAERPRPEMLKFIFDSGDDAFSDITIQKVTPFGDRVRVRVSATRDRTERGRSPTARPSERRSHMLVSLTYVREAGEWKLVREGPAADELALALLEAERAGDRDRLLASESELLIPGPSVESLIHALSRRAGQAAQEARYAAAQAGYELMLDVARRTGSRRFEAEALQNLGNALYFQRNLPGALAAYEGRLQIEREREDEEGIAAAIAGIATIRYSFAEYSAALIAYREALEIQQRLGDEAAVATTLISTGNVLYLQGDYEGAIADYTRSRGISVSLHNPAGETEAWKGLGRVCMARGDYAGALEAFTRVLEEGRARNDRSAQGSAALSLGEAHLRLGNLDVARRTFEESRGHFEAVKDAGNAGRVWQAIALADLMAGRLAMAEEEYRRSAAECKAAADADCSAGAWAGLGFAQAAQDRFSDAIRSYRTAVAGFAALRRVEAEARAEVGLSEALRGDGELEAALDAAARARRAATGRGFDDVLWRALVAEARALRKRGDRSQALSVALAAVHAVERMVEDAQARPSAAVSRETTAVFATLAVLHAESGYAAEALAAAERLRAHELRLTLAPIEREIARGMTAEERQEERALAREVVSLHAQLAREKDLPKPDTARIARLERSLAEAADRRAAQHGQLLARLPELALWRGHMPPAVPDEVRAILEPGTVLVELVLDDRDLLVLTATADPEGAFTIAAELRPVTRRTIAERIGALLEPAALRSHDAWRKASDGFVQLMPAAFGRALARASRAVVVPHEILWRVPVEALLLQGRFVADRVAVVYALSATALLRAPASPNARVGDRLVAAGAPELAAEVRERVAKTAPGWILRDGSRADAEAKAVTEKHDADALVLSGADLTEDRLRRELPAAGVIHVGAPFRINGASPFFSAILLSGIPQAGASSETDAALDVREVMNLDLHARVAVLSDGAALGMREASDDAAAVQWAWRAAGVPALVLARWEADAEASTALLVEFHRHLQGGETPARALDRARSGVRSHPDLTAPFHWAGWFLIGDGRD